jgi:RIO kinase 1
MKIPKRLQPLLEDGLIDEVVGRLMSGKEADVFIVRCSGQVRCAKVYKEASKRGFKQAVTYQEGRKVRNSRRARAMEKGSKFGRQQQEEIWQTTEVDALKLLASAGVRVPVPYSCVDGVLLMEMIVDADGDVAPRLSEVVFTRDEALRDHEVMMQYVVKMLCAGVVHGDLSEFNVLVDPSGPVIIDLPQVVDAAGNNHAEAMLAREVNNISGYYGLYAPELLETKYAKEMWALFEAGDLEPETQLTGLFAESDEAADVDAVMAEIDAVRMEELERQERVREAEDELDG